MAVFFNQATLSYRDTVVSSNIVTGEITESLTASKTAVIDRYREGDTVIYVISLINTGTAAFTDLTVTDNLGAYSAGPDSETEYIPLTYREGSVQVYRNGVLQPDPAVSDTGYLVIRDITVPAGGSVLILYAAQVNRFAPLGAGDSITNQAAVTGDSLTAAIVVTETVYAAEEALSITKSLCPAVVAENGELTYTFLIRNSGNTPAVSTDNVTVTDTFDPALSDIRVTYNGQTWTEPENYTYNPGTGVFATVPGQITVPAAAFTADPGTGEVVVQPGVSILTVTGRV